MTLRQILGGPWSTHWMLWLAFFPGTAAIVLIRESATDYPQWWWPLLAAVLEHLLTGVILVGGGYLARRRHPTLPLTVVAALWLLTCVVRATVGSALAEVVAGVPGDFLFRAVSWIIMTGAWGPSIVYGMAQIDRRRVLIGELEAAQGALAEANARAEESGEEIRARLARTVRRSVAPVLDDLLARLVAVRQDLDRAAFVEISMRLSALHDETANLVDSASPAPRATDAPTRRASLREAFDVPLARPWLTAGVVALQTLAVALPDGTRIFGAPAAREIVLAVALGALALGVTLRFCQAPLVRRQARASTVTFAAVGAAILVSAWAMLDSGVDDITWHGVTTLPLIVFGIITSSTTVIASLVLARANAEEERALDDLRDSLLHSEEQREADLERERHRLSELMHGPVQGRIAACVMALTFFSDGDAAPGSLATITEQVLDHLAAASRDLSLLAEGVPPNGGT
ncbi:hypothetical protein [Yonghaparkia sp. Root332]|uniref:hypothetical protein n=1 Tax=Yonghaparkia sp. Root332 TaxID=1736516 RepID=UPI0012E36E2A|nr:hypothetical protein [Yonghaparkia sp. Root332]